MLFNSLDFAVFLPIVFVFYWFVAGRKLRLQNLIVLISSYVFYGWWDWRFLALIVASSLVNYYSGFLLANEENDAKRKLLLYGSIAFNLGLLGFFKYYNFFVSTFIDAFSMFGKKANLKSIKIILPVGISFYTLQSMSYTIDVYKRRLKPTTDALVFFSFVSFFPQLVAGPIERASNLLPQFCKNKVFDYCKAADGSRQMLWGFFKKIVIADNCAPYVNEIFSRYGDYSGSTLVLGVALFAFQVYGDFSGYSDIAIGCSRLFGLDLVRNFAFPYFSRDIAEFWRRWHISLMTWFRDYVYIPMGGWSRGGRWLKIKITFLIFTLSGIWHGARWNFVAWGLINAVYFLPSMLQTNQNRHPFVAGKGRLLPSFRETACILRTFLLILSALVFFRADSVVDAVRYFRGFLDHSTLTFPQIFPVRNILLIVVLLAVEWLQRTKQHALQIEGLKISPLLRRALYIFIALNIFIFGKFDETVFIYFAF